MELDWIEQQIGDRPYGVDLLLPTKFVGSDQGGIDSKKLDALIPAEHRKFLADLLERYGVPPMPADEVPRPAFQVGYEQQRDDRARLQPADLA
jgi:hypothetical protein